MIKPAFLKKAAAAVVSAALVLATPGVPALAGTVGAQGPEGAAPKTLALGAFVAPRFTAGLGATTIKGVEVGGVLKSLAAAGLESPQGVAIAERLTARLQGAAQPTQAQVLEALALETLSARWIAESWTAYGSKPEALPQQELERMVAALSESHAVAPLLASGQAAVVAEKLARAKTRLSELKGEKIEGDVNAAAKDWEKSGPGKTEAAAPVQGAEGQGAAPLSKPAADGQTPAEKSVPAPVKREVPNAPVPATEFGRASTVSIVGHLAGLILPAAGFFAAMYTLFGHGLDWKQLAIMGGMYSITVLGIGIGFHRYFTHNGFKTGKVMEVILGAMGSMSIEGPMARWVAQHWIHHKYSDTAADPHTPWIGKPGFVGALRGFWHAHVGWMFSADPPGTDHYVKKIEQDKTRKMITRLFPLWAALGVVIPAVAGGIVTGTWLGMLMGFLWGGAARVFLVHHVTFSINSICHLFGKKPFESKDESRNNGLFGLLAFGEGWHNNHHAFQASPKHGLLKGQLDISWQVLRLLAKLGLVWDIYKHVPTAERMDARRAGQNNG